MNEITTLLATVNKRITYAAIPSVSMVSSFARAVVWTLGIIAKSIRTTVVGSLSAFIYIWKKEHSQSGLLIRPRIELYVVVLFSFVSVFFVCVFCCSCHCCCCLFFNHNIYAISIDKLTKQNYHYHRIPFRLQRILAYKYIGMILKYCDKKHQHCSMVRLTYTRQYLEKKVFCPL